MTYRKISTVIFGIKSQIESDLNALDKHENLPEEADNLGKTLAKAHEICTDILAKAEAEPEEEEVSAPAEA